MHEPAMADEYPERAHALLWDRRQQGRSHGQVQRMLRAQTVPSEKRSHMKEAAFKICEHLTKAQAILHDHLECGRYTPEETLRLVNAALSEPRLLLAMQGVGYFENCMCESQIESGFSNSGAGQ